MAAAGLSWPAVAQIESELPPLLPLDARLYLPPPPASHIIDELDLIPADREAALSAELQAVAAKEKLHLYIVLQQHAAPVSADRFLTDLYEHWGRPPLFVLIHYATGVTPTPVLRAAGPDIPRLGAAELELLAREATAAARLTPAVGTQAGLIAETYLQGFRRRWGESAAVAPPGLGEGVLPAPSRTGWSRWNWLAGVAGLISVIGAGVFLLVRFSRPKSRHFPNVPILPRLGAPYAGGSGAVVRYSRRAG